MEWWPFSWSFYRYINVHEVWSTQIGVWISWIYINEILFISCEIVIKLIFKIEDSYHVLEIMRIPIFLKRLSKNKKLNKTKSGTRLIYFVSVRSNTCKIFCIVLFPYDLKFRVTIVHNRNIFWTKKAAQNTNNRIPVGL